MQRSARGLLLAALAAVLTVSPGQAASLGITSADLTAATRSYGAPVTCTLSAVADGYVDALLPTTNFGTSLVLNVNPSAVSTHRALVRFDLTTCSPAIPADAIVQTAELRLTIASLVLASRTIDLRSVTSAWAEAGVTWSTQPTVAGSAAASAGVTAGQTPDTVITWTATSEIQAFLTGAASNIGFRLSDGAEGGAAALLSFRSREAASGQPQLVITYVP